eukprot:TRINITY_DN17527_c0_g1_i1.p1 TRINITY_DN17527_c0_g1~~TRINITY_DN17527_c0_g1_i1.p1  ORF type:complete len:324 (+),score=58.92 TRINITY_DN17527_c0_g1_i1:221-1192(+)
MGCAASEDSPENGAVAPSGVSPVNLACREVVTAAFPGKMLTPTENQEAPLYHHVVSAAGEGLELLVSFRKRAPPQTEIPAGDGAVLSTIFRPIGFGQGLETVLVHAPVVSTIPPELVNTAVSAEDGIGCTVQQYASQGYRLAGVACSTAGCDCVAELVFQRKAAAAPRASMLLQTCISIQVGLDGTVTKLPDFLGTIREHAVQGWSLDGFLVPTSVPPSAEMSTEWNMLVFISMSREEGSKPLRYTETEYKAAVDGGVLRGNPIPLIKEYARSGWLLKGVIDLPGEPLQLPQRLFFEAPVDPERPEADSIPEVRDRSKKGTKK